MVTIEEIKKLREMTAAGITDAKKALTESGGDMEKAKDWLRKRGLVKAGEKSSREVHEGYIGSYIHQNGKIGVLVEIDCETDFVARTNDFQTFAHDVAMHIAAYNPLYVSSEDIEENVIEKMKSEFVEEVKTKPANIQEQIVKGKLEKYYTEVCLLNQPFLKDENITIAELLGGMVGKLGENIKIGRFSRIHIQ